MSDPGSYILDLQNVRGSFFQIGGEPVPKQNVPPCVVQLPQGTVWDVDCAKLPSYIMNSDPNQVTVMAQPALPLSPDIRFAVYPDGTEPNSYLDQQALAQGKEFCKKTQCQCQAFASDDKKYTDCIAQLSGARVVEGNFSLCETAGSNESRWSSSCKPKGYPSITTPPVKGEARFCFYGDSLQISPRDYDCDMYWQPKEQTFRSVIVGQNYIPPLTADIRVLAPGRPRNQIEQSYRLKSADAPLPAKFDWRDSGFLQKPGNQLGCGSCWAFSTASMFRDRVAIALKNPNIPLLSPTYILSGTVMGSNFTTKYGMMHGCMGGSPAAACDFLEQYGTCEEDCWPYSWCTIKNSGCAAGYASNSLLPCFEPNKCLRMPDALPQVQKSSVCCDSGKMPTKCETKTLPFCGTTGPYDVGCRNYTDSVISSFQPYKAVVGSTHSIAPTNVADLDLIKKEIITNGPVVASFLVYQNFENYKSGVYTTGDGPIMGGHAVVIVGWDDKPSDSPFPCWIVRNSWSEKWGEQGYVRIAMYPNNNIGIDVPLPNGLGGVTMCNVDVQTLPKPSPPPTPSPSPSPDSKHKLSLTTLLLIVFAIFAVGVILAIVLKPLKKTVNPDLLT